MSDKVDAVRDDVGLLPRRSRWYLANWRRLSRRERRKLRREPALASMQLAWVAAMPRRLNAGLKRMYSGSIASMLPDAHPLLRLLDMRRSHKGSSIEP